MTRRLLQHRSDEGRRSVIFADHDSAFLLEGVETVRELAERAIAAGVSLAEAAAECGRRGDVSLEDELAAERLIVPIDHPDPAHLHLSGTGLTHLGSAESRDRMHQAAMAGEALTDSIRMFREGLEGGKPPAGEVGQQPEWFYKGDGAHLVGPGSSLTMPAFARDGGEEPELAGIYMIGPDGTPYRLGVCLGNEFSDHVTEKHNYLWLAHSKLRQAAIGPELLLGDLPSHVEGTSRIIRGQGVFWERPFLTGEVNMSHSFFNLEQHHFKYDMFRRPGDIHVHFFGTATISYAEGIQTQVGDIFEIEAAPFSLPLRNRLGRDEHVAVDVRSL
jgi:hypothetical protein